MKFKRRSMPFIQINFLDWRLVLVEMFFLSALTAFFTVNIYLFFLTFFALLLLFYFERTKAAISLAMSLIWAISPFYLTSLINNIKFYDSLDKFISTPTNLLLSLLIFFLVFYLHQQSFRPYRESVLLCFVTLKRFFIKPIKADKKIQKRESIISDNKHHNIEFIIDGKVDPYILKLFLEERGFGLYQACNDRNCEKQLILNEGGIIKPYSLIEIKRWVAKFIYNSPDKTTELLSIWQKFTDIPLKKSVIDHLCVYSADGFKNTTDIQLIKDTEKECFLAFKNGIVKITKQDVEFKKYSSVEGSIFESSIIQRNFEGASRINNMDINKERHLFREFVEKSVLYKNNNATSDCWRSEYIPDDSTKKALISLKTAYGYLLHSYNHPSLSKAIFLVDRNSSPNKPEGGTGKSLIISSLRYLLNQSSQDGKKYRDNPNTGGRFQFSNVEQHTDNIFIDDLKADFNIQSIFTMVTGDIEIERKGQNKFVIPQNQRPKIALTTNYEILTEGTSYKRRIHQVPLGDYWNRCINEGTDPKDELGSELFGHEFLQSDWDDFYIFSIKCIQDYLKLGLVTYS